MENQAERFWTWTLAFYSGPGISPAFLHLQDVHGADVNILLFLLWQASLGHAALASADFASLDSAVATWRTEVIAPLRSLRRQLKGQGEEEVRSPIASAELAAERSSQRRLVAALGDRPDAATTPRETATQGFTAYADFIGAPFDPAAVATLLDAMTQ
jgi:uncharacterized protein (TIGR02444 family)